MTADPWTQEMVDRFWSKVDRRSESECWNWTANKSSDGYGRFSVFRKIKRAHRIVYTLTIGGIPNDRFVCHSCDNPSCCNPAHLFLGTIADNNHDMVRKGRNIIPPPNSTKMRPWGEGHSSSKLTAEDVTRIKERRAAGEKVAAIAKAYGMSQQQISNITNGRNWRKNV